MFRVATIVDKGLYKANNEDRVLINNHVYDEIQFDVELVNSDVLLAVADGVGGENAGEIAASETLKRISNIYPLSDMDYEKTLNSVITDCCDHLTELALQNIEYEGMATTLAGLVIHKEAIFTFNLGNSRVYRYRNGMLRQLTHDHSVVQEMVDAGLLDNSKRDDISCKNIITKYIGSNGIKFDPSIIEHEIILQVGDIFCLSSDGIHDFVSIDEIERVLDKHTKLIDKAVELANVAKSKTDHDNLSIILLEVVE